MGATLVYVETRNITFNFPADLLHQAKVFAAEQGTTVNALVRELLRETLSRQARSRAAADRLLALAGGGPYFTSDPSALRREELHERR